MLAPSEINVDPGNTVSGSRRVNGRTRDVPQAIDVRKRSPKQRFFAALPYLLILLAAAFLYVVAGRIQYERVEGRIGPDLWPKTILLLMIISCFWGGVKAAFLSKPDVAFPTVADEPDADGDGAGADALDGAEANPWLVWGTVAGALVYIWAMPVLGFFLDTVAFLWFVIYVAGFRRPLVLIGLSLCGSLFFMTIFVAVVYVSLPLGIEPFQEVSLLMLKLLSW